MLTRRETQLHSKSTQQGLPKLILNKNVNNNLNQSLQTNFDLWTNSKKTFWLKNQITNHFSQLKSIWNKESIAYKNQRCKTKKERNRIRKRVKSAEPLRTRTKRERERESYKIYYNKFYHAAWKVHPNKSQKPKSIFDSDFLMVRSKYYHSDIKRNISKNIFYGMIFGLQQS